MPEFEDASDEIFFRIRGLSRGRFVGSFRVTSSQKGGFSGVGFVERLEDVEILAEFNLSSLRKL